MPPSSQSDKVCRWCHTPLWLMPHREDCEVGQLEDAHRVTLGFLEKLLDWGWGENAPDLAKQEWNDARAWAEKVRA